MDEKEIINHVELGYVADLDKYVALDYIRLAFSYDNPWKIPLFATDDPSIELEEEGVTGYKKGSAYQWARTVFSLMYEEATKNLSDEDRPVLDDLIKKLDKSYIDKSNPRQIFSREESRFLKEKVSSMQTMYREAYLEYNYR